MPVIDRIKISQEINFNGMPTWIGIEASLLPDEDEKDGLRTLQKSITDYQQQEEKAYRESKWKNVSEPAYTDKPTLTLTEELEACTTFADIQSFRFTVKNDAEKAVYERKLNELSPKNQ